MEVLNAGVTVNRLEFSVVVGVRLERDDPGRWKLAFTWRLALASLAPASTNRSTPMISVRLKNSRTRDLFEWIRWRLSLRSYLTAVAIIASSWLRSTLLAFVLLPVGIGQASVVVDCGLSRWTCLKAALSG